MSKIITQKCKIENCDGKGTLDGNGKRYFTKGYCHRHYSKFNKYGDVNITKRSMNGKSKHELGQTYAQMKDRCYNHNSRSYQNYGSRGITVCDRWLGIDGFTNFISDMGKRPEGYTLDRIDNNKGYSPDNCRWATKHQQQSNMRSNNSVVGVHKHNNRYIATLMVNKKRVLCKSFVLLEEAISARLIAEDNYLKDGSIVKVNK